MVPDVWRGFGGFSFQLDEKSGWFLVPTFFGGSAPLWGSSSSGVLGALVLMVSDSSVSDDVMADDHLFQPGHLAVIKQVGIDVLHKTATKTVFLRRRGGRLQAVCSGHRRRGRLGGVYKDRVVIFFSFKGVLVRFGL
jgi:hypothetical protein